MCAENILFWSIVLISDLTTLISSDVDELKKKLDDIKALSEKLKVLGGELNSSTNSVKGKLNAITCSSVRTCEDMKTLIRAKTAITINFNDLPDIQSNINKVADVQQKNLTGLILQVSKINPFCVLFHCCTVLSINSSTLYTTHPGRFFKERRMQKLLVLSCASSWKYENNSNKNSRYSFVSAILTVLLVFCGRLFFCFCAIKNATYSKNLFFLNNIYVIFWLPWLFLYSPSDVENYDDLILDYVFCGFCLTGLADY